MITTRSTQCLRIVEPTRDQMLWDNTICHLAALKKRWHTFHWPCSDSPQFRPWRKTCLLWLIAAHAQCLHLFLLLIFRDIGSYFTRSPVSGFDLIVSFFLNLGCYSLPHETAVREKWWHMSNSSWPLHVPFLLEFNLFYKLLLSPILDLCVTFSVFCLDLYSAAVSVFLCFSHAPVY